MNTWTIGEQLSQPYSLNNSVRLHCNRCKGKRAVRACLTTTGKPIFEDGVRMLDLREVMAPMEPHPYTQYSYTVVCHACAGSGFLSPIPDIEIFKRKRINIGVERMEGWR